MLATPTEKWNRDLVRHAECAEFRASLDKELPGPSENLICRAFGLQPRGYLRIRDPLIRELEVQDK
jgi:hypothetical protein